MTEDNKDINKKRFVGQRVTKEVCIVGSRHSCAPLLSRSKAGGASGLAVRRSGGSSDAHLETHFIIPTTQSV